jgi:hypothetical protein
VSLLFVHPGALPQADHECRAFGAKHIRGSPCEISYLRAFSHPKRAHLFTPVHIFPRGICTERSGSIPYVKTVFSLYRRFKDNDTLSFILETRVLELHHQSVRFSGRCREASRARFHGSGCFPRHAVGRRGDQLAMRSPRRRATQLPSNFSQKAKFFCNLAPPFPYWELEMETAILAYDQGPIDSPSDMAEDGCF